MEIRLHRSQYLNNFRSNGPSTDSNGWHNSEITNDIRHYVNVRVAIIVKQKVDTCKETSRCRAVCTTKDDHNQVLVLAGKS